MCQCQRRCWLPVREQEILCVMRVASGYQRNTFKISFAFSRLRFLYIRCELRQLERWKMAIICTQGSGGGKKKLSSINWHLRIVFTGSTRATSEPILVIGFAVDLKQHDCLHHLCELAPFYNWLLQMFFPALKHSGRCVCSGLLNPPEEARFPSWHANTTNTIPFKQSLHASEIGDKASKFEFLDT